MKRAWLAVAAIACGDNAGTPDGAVAESAVAIRVTRQSVPLPGIAVIFQRADGAVVATTQTDSDGRAEARVGEGGFVTAVTPFAADQDVKTFVGVSPGDQLAIDGAPGLATPMTTYNVRVAPVAGAVFYRVSVRCLVGTGTSVAPSTDPVELAVTTTCLAPTETLVTALDGFQFPIQSVLGAEATPVDGGTVDLTDAIPSTAETATITLANAPAQTMLAASRTVGRALYLADTEPATNGAHPIVFPDHGGARQTIGVTGARPVYAWGAAAATGTLDVATVQVGLISAPAIDRATRTITWTGAPTANFAFGQLFVDTAMPFLWSFAGPIAPGTTSLVLPPLDAFPLAIATRIDVEVGVGRVDAIDELRRDGTWVDANNGVVSRQDALLRAPSTPGTAGFSFVGASITF